MELGSKESASFATSRSTRTPARATRVHLILEDFVLVCSTFYLQSDQKYWKILFVGILILCHYFISSTMEVMRYPAFVCLSVSLLAGLHKKLPASLGEIFRDLAQLRRD